jgi:hypothetical protein
MTERNDGPALGHTLAPEWHGTATSTRRHGDEPVLPNALFLPKYEASGLYEIDILKRPETHNMPQRQGSKGSPHGRSANICTGQGSAAPVPDPPEVVAIFPAAPVMLQETPGGPSCALCGAPRDARIHLEGKAEANEETPDWG